MAAARRTRDGSGREELIDRIEALGGADGVGSREVGGQWAWRGEGGSGSLGQRSRRRPVAGASERGREHWGRGVGMGAAELYLFLGQNYVHALMFLFFRTNPSHNTVIDFVEFIGKIPNKIIKK